jgi:hypothetical protein
MTLLCKTTEDGLRAWLKGWLIVRGYKHWALTGAAWVTETGDLVTTDFGWTAPSRYATLALHSVILEPELIEVTGKIIRRSDAPGDPRDEAELEAVLDAIRRRWAAQSDKGHTAAIRDLLNAAFNDERLTILCFDYFRPVYDDFASGMSKGQKVQRLLDYCVREEQVDDLLAAVCKANPKQYQRFEGQLIVR